MLIISQDPNQVIPNISEGNFYNKFVLARLTSPRSNYLDVMIKEGDTYKWKGNGRHENRFYTSLSATSMLELLCKTYLEYQDSFSIVFYVVDNWIEFSEVLAAWRPT